VACLLVKTPHSSPFCTAKQYLGPGWWCNNHLEKSEFVSWEG
jgi:hypothetical protein